MATNDFIQRANRFGAEGKACFFLVDFEKRLPFVCALDETRQAGFYFDIKGNSNGPAPLAHDEKSSAIHMAPVSRERYGKAFQKVKEHILKGDSYLLNLTFPTPIRMAIDLEQIYARARAPYRLYRKGHFVIFSPECFIRIENDFIFSYPMKGTIDAAIPRAESIILASEKETWEHNTIVDLIRNDLALVARNIEVIRYRFIDRIDTNRNSLLQVSSEICGKLPHNWQSRLGEILLTLLPAGSISGAPKQRTVEIIRDAEQADRGYFTGIFGVFDGRNLDSAVNIRFIEKTADGLQFRSGGGITAHSDVEAEYRELLDKVYVPTF